MNDKKETPNKVWRLDRIKIEFKTGYSFNKKEEEKHDRYVGEVSFSNNDDESFNLKIPIDMTTRYMDLMREDIIKTAETLGSKIADSIRLVDKKQ